jgi:hypothetical protein
MDVFYRFCEALKAPTGAVPLNRNGNYAQTIKDKLKMHEQQFEPLEMNEYVDQVRHPRRFHEEPHTMEYAMCRPTCLDVMRQATLKRNMER